MGKTFKDGAYNTIKNSKRPKTSRRVKLQPYDRKNNKTLNYEFNQ